MTPAPTRDRADVRILPPLVPVAALLLGSGLGRLWPARLDAGPLVPHFSILGGALVVAAVAIAAWALWTLQRSGQNPHPGTPTPEIVERGPFRFSRNPIYLQMVLLCLGFAIRRLDLWYLLATPAVGWILQRWVILPEEAYLEGKFGDVYLAYKNRVRRWI